MELCYPCYKPLSAEEELRRQVSCIRSKMEIPKMLLGEEVDDVWYVLEACILFKEYRGLLSCIELLDSTQHCPVSLLQTTGKTNLEILEKVAKEEIYHPNAELIDTIARKLMFTIRSEEINMGNIGTMEEVNALNALNDMNDMNTMNALNMPRRLEVTMQEGGDAIGTTGTIGTMGRIGSATTWEAGTRQGIKEKEEQKVDWYREETSQTQDKFDMASTFTLTQSFNRPSSLKTCLFQLAESHDLERITFILETISTTSKSQILKLNKSHLTRKLLNIMTKYCHGDFGFESEVSKLGLFQYFLSRALIATSEQFLDFIEYMEGESVQMLTQMMEEAVIFAFDGSVNGNLSWHSRLTQFLNSSLDFLDLVVNIKCVDYFPKTKEFLTNVEQRLLLLTQQELNIPALFRKHFPDNSPEIVASPDPNGSEDLAVVCPLLYAVLIRVRKIITKLEAVEEFNMRHGEKYKGLFPDTNFSVHSRPPLLVETSSSLKEEINSDRMALQGTVGEQTFKRTGGGIDSIDLSKENQDSNILPFGQSGKSQKGVFRYSEQMKGDLPMKLSERSADYGQYNDKLKVYRNSVPIEVSNSRKQHARTYQV